ncbi:hypothetical protein N657DRAFT_659477 [Parathielavia appendiculata]|uniref:GPI inositol-deacylase n=1 Tax=Parathielavia appendiculata TaxID=2587402 RepID=A0AAN6TR92_9PEZI|nr:hypothetical protein N657DRAFT_659477 [Parathielavia appendiculata]
MENLVASGKARLSNFNILKTKRILEVAKIVPAVNQVEIHPFFPQKELHEFSAKHGILLMAHQPLGGRPVGVVRAHPDEPYPTEDSTVCTLRSDLQLASVCLSWAVQRGIPVVPKSVQEGHMKQNLELKRLPDGLFDEVNTVSSHRGPIRFLDPSLHIGFDIFDEEVDQPTSTERKDFKHAPSMQAPLGMRMPHPTRLRSSVSKLDSITPNLHILAEPKLYGFLAASSGRWIRPFAGLLSRSGTDKSLHRNFTRIDTASSSLSISVSSLDPDDEKGPLGLTTLYEPEPPREPLVDIVFIHGLGGGSRKTWSYSSQPHHYWPRSWLPADNDFLDVRVHTFGYKADWGERRDSILDIHDFAQSLLGALRNHPGIRRSGTRIIFVGHSMGGCVAKKAYILARQDPTAADLAARVQSIFFLATPHRGSDMASILENMLAMAWGKKPYVTDLTPNSSALTTINDAFRHFAPELRLWSFYETLPTKSAGTMSRIVVDRHSATLGYHNEEIAGLDADHRHVCKFDTPAEPNYRTLRNALLTAVDLIRAAAGTEQGPRLPGDKDDTSSTVTSKTRMSPAEATSRLRSFLGIRKPVESDVATLHVLKQPGSCEWFTSKTCFVSWRAGTAPGILWLVGRPAAGKSVLSAHVIEHLSATHVYCSYFICKHGKAGDSTLSDCFRSLAFQMAMQDDVVREAVLQLAQDDFTWDITDEITVWRRLFAGCIFRTPSLAQHFWVVDGVDECVNFNALFAQRLLVSLPKELRLFATSRNVEEIERGLAPLIPNRGYLYLLSDEDTAEDIRLFLTTGLMQLGRPETLEDRELMCEKIIQKSSGSFLWARLVFQEFENAWTMEAMNAVLREIPRGLSELYSRMLVLAKSILTWVVLACRPLTVEELRCANATKVIPDLYRVQVIHDTAREFLLTESFGLAISIHKQQNHTRLASLLLRYLSGDVLKPLPATSQPISGRLRGFSKLAYAGTFFSEHLMDDLANFLLANNVLSWIERIARTGDLTAISRTAINLREYYGRRMKYVPPTDRSMQLVDGWVTDLIRVAAKFRAALLDCPSSIHSLIPPLCPSESIISRTFGRNPRPSPASSNLHVEGLLPGSWDDCLIRMDFQNGQTTALGCGDRFFAIGLSTGQISLYDPTSLQVVRRCDHLERVNVLEFSPEDLLLASCGPKRLVIWDIKSGTSLHAFSLSLDEVLCAFRSCELIKWNLGTEETESISWLDVRNYGPSEGYPPMSDIIPPDPPSRVSFMTTPDGVLLAVGYRVHPVLIWNALDMQLLGTCKPDVPNNGINAMAFNPNPEIPALLVSFQDGSLCVFNYLTMELQVSKPDVYASSVACSSDGRTVAIGSHEGVIEVFEFDQAHNGATITLTIIYRSNHPLDEAIRRVGFVADGLRFVDLRGRQGRVWAPAAVFHTGVDPNITSLPILSANGNFVVAGKSNGDVVLFSAADAKDIGVLYQHPHGASVVSVAIVESRNRVISADDGSRILVVDLEVPLSQVTAASCLRKPMIVLDHRFGGAAARVLAHLAGDRVLVSGRYSDELWKIPSGELAPAISSFPPRPVSPAQGASTSTDDRTMRAGPRSVFPHPTCPEWFVIVVRDVARIYSWDDFTELTSPEGIRLLKEPIDANRTPSSPPVPNISWEHATTTYHVGHNFVVERFQPSPSVPPRVYLWPATELDPSSHSVSPAVLQVLRVSGPSTLLILDFKLWVCSVELQSIASTPRTPPSSGSNSSLTSSSRWSAQSSKATAREPTAHARRHFFALSEWRTGNGELRCAVAVNPPVPGRGGSKPSDLVVFAAGPRLVVVHGGLGFSESVVAAGAMDGRGAGQELWKVVSGSMHRRSSNW